MRGSSLSRLTSILGIILLAASANVARAQQTPNIVINTVQLTSFQIVDNVLTASGTVTGTLAGRPFTTQITNFALQLVPDDPATPATECSVLDLALGPINLALLGLHVDTSPICLEITATEGGGLLGDLLCGLAGGGPLGAGIPVIPTGDALAQLLQAVQDILNGALNNQPAQPAQASSVCTGQCEILPLALGPLDLSLLGLNVSLDDCNSGPVQVCVSATQSEGLLGSLLCGLAGPRLARLSLADITQLLTTAAGFLADGVLSPQEAGFLRGLLGRLLSR